MWVTRTKEVLIRCSQINVVCCPRSTITEYYASGSHNYSQQYPCVQHAPSLVSNDSGKAKYKSHTHSFHCCTSTGAHLESTVAIPCVWCSYCTCCYTPVLQTDMLPLQSHWKLMKSFLLNTVTTVCIFWCGYT